MSQRLILVDGSSLIYRAYFAIPSNFSTSNGLPTNAIYGFATMFKKVLAGKTPDYAAVVFDAPGKTFRSERYPEYKSHRPRMDPELRVQLEWIDKVVLAHNFPLLRVPGYEADDIIATLCKQASAAGIEVHIISSDKDFAQLISANVRMVDTLRDIVYTPELVRKKWGVPPKQFVDWQAMVGDKADNIPGVAGIGAKGAAGLLERFGDLETILASTDQLKGRQKANLVEFADIARLSQELATLDSNTPLPVGIDDLKLHPPSQQDLNALYNELEFYSLLDDANIVALDTKEDPGAYSSILSEKEIAELLRQLVSADVVAILPIFDGASPVTGHLAALAFCWEAGTAKAVGIECPHGIANAISILTPWLEDPNAEKISHNSKELWVCLQQRGITLQGIVGDTCLESFLLDPSKLMPHRLSQIVKEFLQLPMPPKKQILGSGKTAKRFSEMPIDEYTTWCCQRVDAMFRAWPILRTQLVDADATYHRPQVDSSAPSNLSSYLRNIDLPLSWILGAMEIAGILVDPHSLHAMGREFAATLKGYAETIYAHAGRTFNISSPKQLSTVLFEELNLPVIKRTKTGYSTNAEVLDRLIAHHPIAAVLLEHRKLAKLINTYTDVLQREVDPQTSRIHTTFQQVASQTGRLITTDPDLQRTPIKTPEGKRIRETFIAPPGTKLISADWSQIELRLLAHVSGDPLLVESFVNHQDVHARTASQIFSCPLEAVTEAQRRTGKLVNFSTIYGQGASALGHILGVPKKEAQAIIQAYFDAYQGVRKWLDDTMATARSTCFVTTLLGRRRHIPELSSNSYMIRSAGERIAANTPIQGSAADLCKLAMIQIHQEFQQRNLQTRMLLQIHDELVFEVPNDETQEVATLVQQKMETVFPLKVPLVADVGIGDNWRQAH